MPMVPEVEAAFWADESNTTKLPEPIRPQMGNVKRVMGIVGSKVTKYQAGKEVVPGITADCQPWPYARPHLTCCRIGQQQGLSAGRRNGGCSNTVRAQS
jgi:hypothetical protein